MESFHWDDCFLTGLSSVDDQHHRLVDLINRFGASLMQPQGVSAQAIDTLFTDLVDYTKVHFHDEEQLMASAHLDPAYLRRHHQEHTRFVKDLTDLNHRRRGDCAEDAQALLSFLTNWLAYHILGSDQLMAWMMSTAHVGTSSEEAYHAFQKEKDPATAMLLQALNGLFNQVSERNRALLELNQSLEDRVTERTQALQLANAQLEKIATTDALTGLANRRQALLTLEHEWLLARRLNQPLACMMLDADGFKGINDSWGHDAGDEVLRQLARRLVGAVRTDDAVFRLGGDEFLILCAATPLAGALLLAEKLRQDVASLCVPVAGGQGEWRGSISVGVAASQPCMDGPEQLLKAADEGVYLAKRAGRNAVATAQAS